MKFIRKTLKETGILAKFVQCFLNTSEQHSAGIYLLKVSNRNSRTKGEICSKLTIKTPERRHSSVSIVNFEHEIAGWTVVKLAQFSASFQILAAATGIVRIN